MTSVDGEIVASLERLTGTPPGIAEDDVRLNSAIERLFNELGLGLPLGKIQGRGSLSVSPNFQDEARWLLAAGTGPAEAVTRLRGFVSDNEASCKETLLFWGIHPSKAVELAENIELAPLDSLAPSDPRDYFLGLRIPSGERGHSEYQLHFPKPRAVLTRLWRYERVYFNEQDPPPADFTYGDKHYLEEIMLTLPLTIRSPVIRIAEWVEWPADQPVLCGVNGYGYMTHPRAVLEHAKTGGVYAALEDVASKFLALDESDRRRLRLPLRRLNAVFLANSYSDRAIEAGIAFEALLTGSNDAHDGLNHRLSVRAAVLTEVGLASRQAMQRRAKDLYTLRSATAHGADLDDLKREEVPLGLSGRFRRPDEIRRILNDAPDLLTTIAKAILDRGGFPDFQALDLLPDEPR